MTPFDPMTGDPMFEKEAKTVEIGGGVRAGKTTKAMIAAINEFCKRVNQRAAAEGRSMPISIVDACETLEEMFPGSTTD